MSEPFKAYTISEVAQLWGVSPRTISNLIKRGKLEPFYVTEALKSVRITAEELARYSGTANLPTSNQSEP